MSTEKSFGARHKARILIVDDHSLVREGLIQLIKRQGDMSCCGEADTDAAAQKAVAQFKPDLVVLDLRLGNGDGLDLIKVLISKHPGLLVLVVSQCDETLYAERALKAGARGYVMKERATAEILKAIRSILAGELYVSSKISALALHKMIVGKSRTKNDSLHLLTDRELQVLQLLGGGLSTKKAAEKLGLSFKTVETHRENIKHKLGLATAPELVRYATSWIEGRPFQNLPMTDGAPASPVPPELLS